ncbi:hypothetical protein VTN31DRAFT_4886 [Thermomyces dupontii]|uniref:uncharacterized protein n=1 Tax=Talaromyces thermophilus TaxID=28565 RepID=UPI003742323A
MGLWKSPWSSSQQNSDEKEQPPSENEANHNSDDLNKVVAENDLSASAQQAAGTAWLAGRLNHLTPEQEEKLVEFKRRLQEAGYYTPESKDGTETREASHSDSLLLRFLRARKFDVAGAIKQFTDTENWRKENAIDALYDNIDLESYEETRLMYPQWTGRRDYRGIPVYLFEIKHLTSKRVAEFQAKVNSSGTAYSHKESKIPARLLCLFSLYENLLNFVHPVCSMLDRPNPETPIMESNNIVDISGVSLMQFWNLRSHMQDASVLSTAHYPETLDRIFIIGAPSFFPTVWGWIKRWFDPVTVSKIFILSQSEVKSTLEKFMPPSSIPEKYGGTLKFQFGDMPNLDDAARELIGGVECGPPKEGDTKPTYLKGPMRCYRDHIEVLGTVNGTPRRMTIPLGPKASEPPSNGRVGDTVSNEKVDGVSAEPVTNGTTAA